MDSNFKKLVSEMTLEEKVAFCSGRDFWHIEGLERLEIPSVKMADGPHGLNTRVDDGENKYTKKVPATCFPTAVNMASSWDTQLIGKMAEAIAKECRASGVSILLGPGVNIKRSPLCGRNFEYFSEDPYLSGEMAAAMIDGLQKNGVGACLKHFAANNREERRHTTDSVVGERALREIYLTAFEKAVKQSRPWAIMAAYNKLNGDFCCENKYLLTDILRELWNFEGIAISDWYACNDKVKSLNAGLDIEMPPGGKVNDKLILDALKDGRIEEKRLDTTVERILDIIYKAYVNKVGNSSYDENEHHLLARSIASETMVLLKNDENILPLKPGVKIAVIGSFAKNPRYQGTGSSKLEPTKLDNLYDELAKIAGEDTLEYSQGYDLNKDDVNMELIEKACTVAKESEVALLCVGLPEPYEKEGWDRDHMKLPLAHTRLIEEVSKVQPNIVVVLSNGAAVEMPWTVDVKAILETYLGGQAGAGAAADILFGIVNPSGKLAEGFPVKLSDNPSYLDFMAYPEVVEYGEGIFTGYRYYEKKEMKTLFPFGYGLSYTTFEYTGISVSKEKIMDNEALTVGVKVKNTGSVKGKEIVQLYVKDIVSTVARPEKELKAFAKIELEPGEEKEVIMTLDFRSFAYFDTELADWYVETGDFKILVGPSSRNIALEEIVFVEGTKKIKKLYHMNTAIVDLASHPAGKPLYDYVMQFSNLTDIQLGQMHLRSLVAISKGQFSYEMLQDLLNAMNGSEDK